MRAWLCLCLLACSGSPHTGGTGRGTIVFTTPFVSTSGFASAVAVGRPIIVATARENAPMGEAAAEMSLQISGGPYRIVTLAAGQSLVWLDAEADYRFVATRYGAYAGEEPYVRARPIRLVRTYEVAQRITRGADGCEQREEVNVGEMSLASNQEVQVTIVGIDQTEQPTSGWLSLIPQTVPAEINVETPFIGSAGTPNTFSIRPATDAALGSTVSLVIVEAVTMTNVTVSIPTSADTVPCEALQ